MRRSFRDAIVGFSIIGGIAAFAGSMLWLRGVRIASSTWEIKATFADASGLSERSPVTYRGINIGSVERISITSDAVEALIKIDKTDLILPLPVSAKVSNSSLLGGDVEVALISNGVILNQSIPLPLSKECPNEKILCNGAKIEGKPLNSISTLSEELEKIVKQAGEEDLMQRLVDSTEQFDRTQRELEELILQAKIELRKADPILTELSKASYHLNNILAAINNPKTLEDIQETASSTRQLTARINDIGEDMNKIMEDEELMNAFRNVTIGLGQFFNEIYPSETNPRK